MSHNPAVIMAIVEIRTAFYVEIMIIAIIRDPYNGKLKNAHWFCSGDFPFCHYNDRVALPSDSQAEAQSMCERLDLMIAPKYRVSFVL